MRTTITINDKLYRALKMRAAETDATVSELVEDAVKFQIFEDLEDIEAYRKRVDEPSLSLEAFVKALKADGLI